MGGRGYPAEFRRKVLDLVAAGRPIAEIAKALGISARSIYTRRRCSQTGVVMAQR
jgi:transposase